MISNLFRHLLGETTGPEIPHPPVYFEQLSPDDSRRETLPRMSVVGIQALPVPNGNYHVFLFVTSGTESCIGEDVRELLGEFPPEVYVAIQKKKIIPFSSDLIAIEGAWIRADLISVARTFTDLTGVRPILDGVKAGIFYSEKNKLLSLYNEDDLSKRTFGKSRAESLGFPCT